VSDQSTLAHEAGHVVGALLAGHRIESVRLGATKKAPRVSALTTLDWEESPKVDLYAHLISILMGPLAAGEPPPAWPPLPNLDNDAADEHVVAHLVVHLRLSRADYMAALALAAGWLDDPLVKSAIAKVAHALGREGVLTGQQIRDVLGPGLVGWLELAEPRRQGEPCNT
jgi:hypothetical protein